MSAMNPQLGAALQNPAIRQMMTNPAFLQQMGDPNTMNVSKIGLVYGSCKVLLP